MMSGMRSRVYHQRLFSTMHSVPIISSCPVSLETDWHVSFLQIFHPLPAPGNQCLEITMGVKIKLLTPFILVYKRCALMRGFQIWSQN